MCPMCAREATDPEALRYPPCQWPGHRHEPDTGVREGDKDASTGKRPDKRPQRRDRAYLAEMGYYAGIIGHLRG